MSKRTMVMLHINSVYSVLNITEIDQNLYKLQSYEKVGVFWDSVLYDAIIGRN